MGHRLCAASESKLMHRKHPNFTVYWRQDIPARFRYVANSVCLLTCLPPLLTLEDLQRIMPIIGIADEGWSVTARKGGYPITKKGTHGLAKLPFPPL